MATVNIRARRRAAALSAALLMAALTAALTGAARQPGPDGKAADHASIEDPAAGGNPGGFLGYATAWLEYQLRGNAAAAGAFTGAHPELTANPNWPASAVK